MQEYLDALEEETDKASMAEELQELLHADLMSPVKGRMIALEGDSIDIANPLTPPAFPRQGPDRPSDLVGENLDQLFSPL